MTIQLPDKLEAALKAQADAQGVSPAGYVRGVLERELAASLGDQEPGPPFKMGRGLFAKYGPAPPAEEIDANRAEMFHRFAEEARITLIRMQTISLKLPPRAFGAAFQRGQGKAGNEILARAGKPGKDAVHTAAIRRSLVLRLGP